MMMMSKNQNPYQMIEKMRRENPRAYVIQLATVSKDGKPKVRSVLFEDLIMSDGNNGKSNIVSIAMKCSRQSEKFAKAIEEGRSSDFAEVVWWVEDANVQWRFSGTVDLILEGDERRRLWDHMNIGGKAQFLCDQKPGSLVTTPMEMREKQIEKMSKFEDETKVFDLPFDDFMLCVLRAEEIDYLNLANCERKNWIFDKESANGNYSLRSDGYAVPVVSTVNNKNK